MPKMQVNGINLYYEVHGQGEPVALLNGIMQNTAGWAYQTPVLSKHFKVILHDMRGQGQSDKPKTDYTWDQHVEDFKALLDNLGIDKLHVVGVSYGAETAMCFALKYPERVKSVVFGTAISVLTPLVKAFAESWDVAAGLNDGLKFFKLFSPSIYGDTFYKNQGKWLDERAEAFAKVVTADWFDGFQRLLKNFYTLDVTDQLSKITAPVLVLAAEKDLLKPVHLSRLIADQIPQSEMLIISDSGHVALFEKPNEFNTAVLGFLMKNS
jgi:pimeloyl-ACP methyl ester carboxylesterase